MLISAAVLLVMLARFPRQFFVAVVVVVAFAILRPRVRKAGVGGQGSGVRGWKSEVGSRKSE
jgi:hypothetical protein